MDTKRNIRRLWLGCSLVTATVAMAQPATQREVPADFFDALKYRFVGPLGNRVSAVTGVAGDANVFYIGAASGGIFKSTDGGHGWKPIFDDQPVASIGALAVAPSDPNVVWAGTGETFIRSNISVGNGIFKSVDAGAHWQAMGLEQTGRIGRVIVHPTNSDIVYAAALGHSYGPQPERGVYRTRDGGESWEQVLFVDEDTGAVDLVMDPSNPRILFAATWQLEIWTWGRQSGGPGSGLYISRDGGDNWTQLEGKGLPKPPWGKIGLAMSAADPARVYALIETSSNRDFAPSDPFQGVLWRSDNGGARWQVVSHDNTLTQRPLYYTRAAVAPDDADEIYFLAVEMTRSLDGGASIERLRVGGDHHDMWIDPADPRRMIVGHDQGISISTTRGKRWFHPQLPIAQMYHVHTDNEVPYFLYGNRQDGPSTRGPSNTLTFGPIPVGAWAPVGGCETGFALPDPRDSNTVWTGCYDGSLTRHDRRSGQTRDVSVWPVAIEGWAAADLKYRFQWTFPVALSPHDPDRIYAGSQHVHQTTDGGNSWREISPDLTTGDVSMQARSGGLTFDDAGPTVAPTVFAIAESPREAGVIWAGTNDGQVQISRDGGGQWANVTPNLSGLPPWGTVSNIEPSRHSDGVAYLTVDLHQVNDPAPYVYKTADYGATWQRLGDDLPRGPLAYAHCVREDPVRPGLLYLGTENALHVSFDDGAHWQALQSNLPHAPVHWLTVQEHFNDLVVATYGRGFWILDDITPLQQLDAARLDGDATLFAPRPAYRFRMHGSPMQQPGDPAAGENPTYGALIHYSLKEEPEGEVKLEILDAAGETVDTLPGVGKTAGLHRVSWNLRYALTEQVKLRTKPDESPHVTIPDKGWRRLSDSGRFSLLAPPGTYTVKLTVGETSHTQPLTVLRDPRSPASEADLAAQMEVLMELRGHIDEAVALINEIEWARAQLDDLAERLAGRDGVEEVVEAGEALDGKLKEIEGHFFDLRLTGARQDTLRWPRLLYARFIYLAGGIGLSDHAPTTQHMEVYAMLKAQLGEQTARFAAVKEEDIAAYNAMLRDKEIPAGVMTDFP